MVQLASSIRWLLKGSRYDHDVTPKPHTVDYYCGELTRFVAWAEANGIGSDVGAFTKYHIQAFSHHIAEAQSAVESNGPKAGAETS